MDKVANFYWYDIVHISNKPADILVLAALNFNYRLDRTFSAWATRYSIGFSLTVKELTLRKMIKYEDTMGIWTSTFKTKCYSNVDFTKWYLKDLTIPEKYRAYRLYLESICPIDYKKWIPKSFIPENLVETMVHHNLIEYYSQGYNLI